MFYGRLAGRADVRGGVTHMFSYAEESSSHGRAGLVLTLPPVVCKWGNLNFFSSQRNLINACAFFQEHDGGGDCQQLECAAGAGCDDVHQRSGQGANGLPETLNNHYVRLDLLVCSCVSAPLRMYPRPNILSGSPDLDVFIEQFLG